MAFVTVYDIDGNPHEKEPVDARECVEEMGWSMNPPMVCDETAITVEDEPIKRGRKSKGNEAE